MESKIHQGGCHLIRFSKQPKPSGFKRLRVKGLVACTLIALAIPSVEAATKTWNSSSNQLWLTAGNWSAGLPGAGDIVLFNGLALPPSGTVGIDLKNNETATLQAISMTLAAGNLTIGNNGTTGNTNPKKLILSGVTINSVANTILSNSTTAASTLTIQNTVLGGDKNLYLELSTAANFIQASTNNTIAISSVVSQASGTTASITFQGGGTLALSGSNTFGGSLSITDGTLRIATINNAGASGVLGNSFNSVTLGSSGKIGIVEYTGATASSNKTFAMVSGGTGGFQVVTAETRLTLSGMISGSGAFNKGGAGTLILSAANTYTGALSVQDGILEIATINNAGANGVLGNSSSAVTLGSSGKTGVLKYTGATGSSNKSFTTAGNGGVVDITNAGAGLTLSGVINGSGALSKKGAGTLILSAANTYTGALNVEEGTLEIATINHTAADGVLGNSSNAVTLGSSGKTGALKYTGATGSSNRSFIMAGGGGVFDITNAATKLALSGNISGNGSLQKAGAGTLILNGTNTYSGGTNVTGGELIVNGSHTGDLTVAVDGFLGGSATINGKLSVNTGGAVSPGNSTAIMHTGDFETAFGAHISIELGGSVAGYHTDGTDGYDQIAANGTVTLALGTEIHFTLLNSYTPAPNTTYNILTATNGFGSTDINTLVIDGLTLPDTYSYSLQFADLGGGVTALQLAVIPEPEIWAMFAGGLGMLLCWGGARRGFYRA